MQSVCLCVYLQLSDLQMHKIVKIQSTLLNCFFSTNYIICTFSWFFLILDDDVTTAVDIYSFGMCVLEVRLVWLTVQRLLLQYNSSVYDHVCWCV